MRKTDRGLDRLDQIFLRGISLHRHKLFRKLLRLQSVGGNAILSTIRRWWFFKRSKLLVPIAIAFSPTMNCNLSCVGCYAKDYPKDDEVSIDIIDNILSDGEKWGVFLFVITGGEPLMREGILDVFRKHKKLLFLMITNGTLMDDKIAKEIADTGNIIPVVSIEGTKEQTDNRRGFGVYDDVITAMDYLEKQKILFGFSSTVTKINYQTLSSDEFIDDMISKGCSLGFYTEYVPIGDVSWEFMMEEDDRSHFRKRVLEIRNTKPIMVAHLPNDEYGDKNLCRAVQSGSFHINSQGYVEPCPFAHFSGDNIKEKSLKEIFQSRFLQKLRSSEAIYRHGNIGCALLENIDIVHKIAQDAGANDTEISQKLINND